MLQMPNFNVHTPDVRVENRFSMIREREQGTKIDSILDEYNIARPTFYKFYKRYKQFGRAGLYDLSKAPLNHGLKTKSQDEKRVEDIFTQHPYFSSYELNQLVPLNPRTIQRIIKRKNLKKVYKSKSEKKTILEKLKKELYQRKILKK